MTRFRLEKINLQKAFFWVFSLCACVWILSLKGNDALPLYGPFWSPARNLNLVFRENSSPCTCITSVSHCEALIIISLLKENTAYRILDLNQGSWGHDCMWLMGSQGPPGRPPTAALLDNAANKGDYSICTLGLLLLIIFKTLFSINLSIRSPWSVLWAAGKWKAIWWKSSWEMNK